MTRVVKRPKDTTIPYNDLMALFADNTTGNISPEDLRKFVTSVAVIYGTVENTKTQADVQFSPTWAKIDCSEKQTGSNYILADKASSSIVILEDGYYKATAYIEAGGSGFNWTDVFQFAIARNGKIESIAVNLVQPIFSNEEFTAARVETILDDCMLGDEFTLMGRRVNTSGQPEPITFNKTWLNVEKQPVVIPTTIE